MTALRQLSVVYVAAAGAYAIAMAMSAHPTWVRVADQTAHYVRTNTAATAIAFDEHVLRPDIKMAEAAGRALAGRQHAVRAATRQRYDDRVKRCCCSRYDAAAYDEASAADGDTACEH